MIAYMPYSLCPEDARLEGLILEYPWIQQDCAPEDVESMTEKGWTVLSEADYQALLDSLADELALWNEIYNTPTQEP